MPVPASIICCGSISRDLVTGLFSYISVIEYVSLPRTAVAPEQLPPGTPTLNLNIVARWMREEGDASDAVFEVQNVLKKKNATDHLVGRTEFKFDNNSFHTVISRLQLAWIAELGVFYAESAIRRLGEQEWLCRQQYPIVAKEREEVPSVGPHASSPSQPPTSHQNPVEPSRD